ncbi:response regulator [Miltoncostaea marina]|uniref:response regulator n=1 Tax=Miltoncostaea marina TaxID=2843215 RepID=UPI001C3DCA43|nr:response regulator transcription factor [Miltoncostaea marina]
MATTDVQNPPSPTTTPLRVAIADDHRLMLDGIKRALETAPDIKVVGEAMSGEEMLSLVPRVRPDVVILDLRMPKGDGLTTLAALRKDYPDLKIIILSMFEDSEHIDQALHQGASGYVVKSINPLDLPSTVRQVVEGTVYHPRGRAGESGSAPAASAGHPGGLTDRELSILRLVAEGLSNLDIASKLYVTEQTVKFHLSNIYRKLGVGNRTEATRYAYRNGMIE